MACDPGTRCDRQRRAFLRGAAAAAVAAALPRGLGDAPTEARPSFLFLLTDDQTFNAIRAMDNPAVHTPHLDRLAGQGVVFTHCFNQGSWSGAVCIASRAMLNTGMSVFRAQEGIRNAPLWGETFTRAGWDTFLTGKWHNGAETALRSFAGGVAIGAGMYESPGQYGRPAGTGDAGWQPDDETAPGHWQPKVWDILPGAAGERRAGPPYTVRQHTSELYADVAIDFLRRPERQQRPFFLYVSFNAPHDPRQSPRRFLDLYPPETLTVPPSFLPEHPFDQGDNRIRDERLAPFPRTEAAVRLHTAEYYAMVSHLDEQVGRILAALDAAGLSRNTYVIVSSDHGLAVGRHGLMGKQNQYDHSVRMPLLIRGPGIAAGRRVHHLVYLHSMFATTCTLADVPVPPTVEFPSLAPLLTGDSRAPLHEAVFGTYRHLQRMVRTDDWKLIVYPVAGRRQLFHLATDPNETRDLAGTPEAAAIEAGLQARLRALQRQLGDPLDLDKPPTPSETGQRPGAPVHPQADGSFRLAPETAAVSGRLRYQPDRGNLGAWFDRADQPSWRLAAAKPGMYSVRFEYGCTSPGVPFVIRCGTAEVAGVTQHTGDMRSYRTFEVGTLSIPGGDLTLDVAPGPFTGAFVNLRGISLVPVPGAP